MFSQMKTATKILLGFAFCILVSLVMGIAGYSGISDAENAMSTVGKTSLPSVKAVDQMLLAQQRVAYFNLMLNNRRVTDLTERARLQESVTENVKAFGQARSDYEPQPRTPRRGSALARRWAVHLRMAADGRGDGHRCQGQGSTLDVGRRAGRRQDEGG